MFVALFLSLALASPTEGDCLDAASFFDIFAPTNDQIARALPYRGPTGDYDGFRLSSIGRLSVLDRQGVKNGDVITAIEGQSITAYADVAEARSALAADATALSLTLLRRGEPLSLELTFDCP
jgi:S1-C subfamily serine protease